jgi:cytochrome P450
MTHRPDLLDITLIKSFAEADEILKSRDFRQDQRLEPSKAPALQGNLNSLHGHEHFQRRRAEGALFRRGQLLHYESDILLPELRAALRRLAAQPRIDGRVRCDDLPMLVRSALVRVSANLIGIDLVDDEAVDRLLAYSSAIAEGRDVVWSTTNQDDVVRRVNDTWKRLQDEFYRASRERRERLQSDPKQIPVDLISVLLSNPEAIAGHPEADMIAYELGLFLTASVNTTTVATPKTVDALLRWIEVHPEDRARLDHEGFLRQAAQEALRLYPTVPYLLREAERDSTLSTGRQVASGSLVRIDIGAANRDPAVFGADADQFNPHRLASIPRRYGLSFGGGIHMCIGLELTTGNQSGDEDERTTGMVIQILRELFAAGIELDPNDAPRLRQNTTQHKYERFPVTFSRL